MESPLVTLKHASKSFVDGKETHRVLEGVDFTLNTGASVALTGASGSGKVPYSISSLALSRFPKVSCG